MKQKWLVTAPEMSYNQESNDTPTNYRDDAVAFATVVTCTASSTPGSLWVEYNVEFASPKAIAPVVNATVYTTSSGTPTSRVTTTKLFTESPVAAGETFYAGATEPFTYTLNDGYQVADTGTTPLGRTWLAVRETALATGSQWCSSLKFGTYSGAVQAACSGSLQGLTKILDGVSIS